VKLPGAEPLSADAMGRFHTETAPWLDALAAPQPLVQQSGLASSADSGATAVPFVDAAQAQSMPFSAGESQFVGERRTSVKNAPL
jgi:hypothetical protein